ncbi:endonuclease V [Halobacteriales archaeon SW_12_71_31]|nr:MAG: endonuclease V [Halobacteriales archaeon SW_12_71_31]
MRRLQRAVADAAVFEDDHDLAVDRLALREPLSLDSDGGSSTETDPVAGPTVVGVDVAFRDDRAAAAAVAVADGRVVEVGEAVVDLAVPYVPGLLAFREGEAVLAALSALDRGPDLLVVDGSGRIHYRTAGLATHLGVILDRPAVGVAKSLLCGRPRRSVEEGLPEGECVPVEADDRFEYGAAAGEVVGHAVSTRQYDSPDRHVNPLYVSPGHRVGAETAADLALALSAGYKLPEPTRLADAHADAVKRRV